MEKRNIPSVLIALSALLTFAFYLGKREEAPVKYERQPVSIDTVTVRDTLRLPPPPPEVEVRVRYIPVTDTVVIRDTVMIPILQKVYETPDYKAWVSGYHAALDSIHIYPGVTTITRTIPQRRWGLGVIGGYGIGIGGLSPYVGLGVYYRIW